MSHFFPSPLDGLFEGRGRKTPKEISDESTETCTDRHRVLAIKLTGADGKSTNNVTL